MWIEDSVWKFSGLKIKNLYIQIREGVLFWSLKSRISLLFTSRVAKDRCAYYQMRVFLRDPFPSFLNFSAEALRIEKVIKDHPNRVAINNSYRVSEDVPQKWRVRPRIFYSGRYQNQSHFWKRLPWACSIKQIWKGTFFLKGISYFESFNSIKPKAVNDAFVSFLKEVRRLH